MKRKILITIDADKRQCGKCLYKRTHLTHAGFMCTNRAFQGVNDDFFPSIGDGDRLGECLEAEAAVRALVKAARRKAKP